jgi:hypothetical protein
MSVWEEDKSAYVGLRCERVPYCPICFMGGKKRVMTLWDAKLLHFYLWEGKSKTDSNAIDVVTYCRHDGYMDINGVAVRKEHREEIQRKIENDIKSGDLLVQVQDWG